MLQERLMGIEKVGEKTLIVFLILVITIFSIQNNAFGKEKILDPEIHQVVINDLAMDEELYPDSIEIEKGDTIIWFNQGVEPVKVRFINPLGIVCYPIIHFDADVDGIFVSDIIPQGGFASLCLINEGVFDYEVVRLNNNEGKELWQSNILQGKAIVE
jgi:hypothetical protein